MDTVTANDEATASEVVIRAGGLGKVYRLYNRPQDRLKELVFRRRSLGQDFWAVRDLDLEIGAARLSASSAATARANRPCCR